MKIYEFNSFEEFERAEVAGEDEALTIVTENGWIKSDLVTVCKSWKTALRRFFKALSARHPEIAEWTESLTESAENGYFRMNDSMMADGTQNPFPGYAWEIEEVQEGVWYIFLNVRQDEDKTPAEATENATETTAKAETITAASTRQAWEIAGEILGTDYTEDTASTARAGYSIHRSTAEGNRGYICDLGDRLEVNLQDGSSRNIWISREALAEEAATAQKIQKLRETVTKQAAQVEELTHAADLSRYLQKEAERERDEATADRDRIAEELRELKNKLFHLSLVIA